jgi:rubrerythrin
MNTDDLRRSKDLLLEYSKKELERVDEQVKIITAELGKRHYVCSLCNTKISDRELPEKCSNV